MINKWKYKLLVLDMDGTTLDDKGEISDINRKAIKRIVNEGIKVALISGRCQYTLSQYARSIGLNGYMSALNGNIIFNLDNDEIIHEHIINKDIVENLLNLSKDIDSMISIFIKDDTYVEDIEDPFSILFQKFTELPFIETGDMFNYLIENNLMHKVNKIAFVDEYDNLKDLKDTVLVEFLDSLTQAFSLPICLEIYKKSIGKGSALKEISELYNIKSEEIIAIGDGENDIEMLKYAGLGIAPANCMPSVIKYADEITVVNTDNAVAEVINKYFPLY